MLEEHQQAFERMKKLLTSNVIVKFFDSSLPTELLTDASRLKGLGFALIQVDKNNQLCLVSCGSRSLSSAESRYATVELECLAIHFALGKCRHFLLGMPMFTIVTDHKPLLGVFKNKMDETTNPRLLRMQEKMVNYSFELTWREGKSHLIADALSRAPVFDPPEECITDDAVGKVLCLAVAADPRLQELFDVAEEDSSYQDVIQAIVQGKKFGSLPEQHYGRSLSNVWDHISVFEDALLVLNGHRIIVPPAACRSVLQTLHIPHAGLTKTRKAAAQMYYWPGINSDIKNTIQACNQCQELRPSQSIEPIQFKHANEPMSEVGIDLMQVKENIFWSWSIVSVGCHLSRS